MSQEKLNRINALHQLSGEEYHNQFRQISLNIIYAHWKDLLQYQQILDKAVQPSQKDHKQCPRTRAQTVQILKRILKSKKQDHINVRDFLKSIGQFKEEVKDEKQHIRANKSIFSTIWSYLIPQKKINLQKKQISKQEEADEKDSIEKYPDFNDENQDMKSNQEEQPQGLLSQIQLQQKNLLQEPKKAYQTNQDQITFKVNKNEKLK